MRREKETSSVHRLQGHKWAGVNDRARRTPKEQYCKAAYAKVYETTMAVCNEGPKISPNNALPPQPICSIKFLLKIKRTKITWCCQPVKIYTKWHHIIKNTLSNESNYESTPRNIYKIFMLEQSCLHVILFESEFNFYDYPYFLTVYLFDESGNLGRLCDVEEVEGLSR